MYDDIYEYMVHCDAAKKLNEVSHQCHGDLTTKHHLAHPEMCCC